MNRLQAGLSLSLLSVAALTGCSGLGSASFPDASVNPESASLGSISGSNYGGHAPLVGAHVYVLQPSVTTAATAGDESSAYGYQASSILNTNNVANGAGNPNAIQNSGGDPGLPTTWYYQKTDTTGAFNISGDYTCTVGLPVYLYLYGGSPTFPSANNTFTITNVVFSGTANPYTVTMTINTSGTTQNIENAYVGEFLTITGLNNVGLANVAALNATDQTVIGGSGSTALTTTQFSFSYASTLPFGVTTGTNYAQTGTNQVTFDPTFNPGVVNLAMLGNCPSGGFTGTNSISYVYVNEVATTAAAYALAPFTPPTPSTSNDYATYIGTSSLNVAGIQNAAVIAKQLYDITGSQLSTSYAGEGHIANSRTVGHNGIVPQANLDTIGNILAACVDSNNGATTVGTGGGYNGATGAYSGISPQCNTLFSNATSNGVLSTASSGAGIQPYDTAMAAINMARHPAGPTYAVSSTGSATFMSNLYSLPTGNRPFQPDLASTGAGQPNDFTIGIAYTPSLNSASTGGSYMNYTETVAIDQIGNVWTVANNSGSPYYFYKVSPAGAISNVTYQTGWQYGSAMVDSGESAWAGAAISNNPVTYVQATSTPAASSGSAPVTYTYNAGATNTTKNTYYSYSAVGDSSGDVYFGNAGTNGSPSSSPLDYIATFAGAATTPTVGGTESASLTGITNASNISFLNGSIEPGGTSAFFEYNAYELGQVEITSVKLSTGGTDTGFPVYGENTGNNPEPVQTPTAGCTSLLNSGKLTTTRSGDVIVPDFHNQSGAINDATSSLYYINKGTGTAGTCTQISGATLNAGLKDPWASTLDGNDYVYIVNRPSGNSSLSVVNTQSNTAAGTVAVSPSTGFIPQYWNGSALTDMLTNPFGAAVGPSGEIWIPNNDTAGGLVEIVGLGFPTTTPLSFASKTKTTSTGGIGYRP